MTEHLGELEQVLLFALVHTGPGSDGLAIRREVASRTGRDIAPGALYTAMDRLEGRGYVASRLGEATPVRGGRRKKLYSMEPAGARALESSYERVQRMAAGARATLARLTGSELA